MTPPTVRCPEGFDLPAARVSDASDVAPNGVFRPMDAVDRRFGPRPTALDAADWTSEGPEDDP